MMRKTRQQLPALRARARTLRQRGYTYTEICSRLGVIPQSTLAYWFKDVHLNGAQQARIRAKVLVNAARARPLARAAWAKKMERWKDAHRQRAAQFVEGLDDSQSLAKLACAMLYLAEGQKYPGTRHLGFSNSDPTIIRLFLALLRTAFPLDESKFRCRVCRRYDQDYQQLISYWSGVTGIIGTRFFKSKPDPRTVGKPTQQAGYHGVCVVYYLDVNMQYELQAIGEAFGKLVEQRGIEPLTSTLPVLRSPN